MATPPIPTPYLLPPGDGAPRWSFSTLTLVKATGDQTGGRFALIEDLAPRGDGTPLHRHPDDDESFYVLDGAIEITLGDAPPALAPAGSFVHIPAGVPHAFTVTSDLCRYLILTTPQHGRFYDAISDPAPAPTLPGPSEPDWDRILAACAAHNVEILPDPTPDAPS